VHGDDCLIADVSMAEGNQAMVEAALERHGRLDILVLNAGTQAMNPIATYSEADWDRLMNLMVKGPFLAMKFAWPHLTRQPGGRIIVTASTVSLQGAPYKAAYVAAKHGVLGLVKTLALEGADQGITATAVCPGFVRTPLVESQIAGQAKAHGISEERVLEDVILAPHAVKRLIEPEEVADTVAFLLGPGGRAFTGVPVTMDLGWTAR
jgi:3-hydroxybutyrate dehydrogenase